MNYVIRFTPGSKRIKTLCEFESLIITTLCMFKISTPIYWQDSGTKFKVHMQNQKYKICICFIWDTTNIVDDETIIINDVVIKRYQYAINYLRKEIKRWE